MKKMRKNIYAILLAGGKGTRLWPLSTQNYSKSFVRIGNRRPLIEDTIKRLFGLVKSKNIVVVVDNSQEKLLKEFVRGIPKKHILVEPFGRSTASAAGLAAIELRPEDIMVVLPTDSLIKEPHGFRKAVKSAVNFVDKTKNALLCVGIKPREATSAYGYIKLGLCKGPDVYSIDKFIEKPEKKKAERMVKNGNYLWNAGMFVFRAKDILTAIKKHAPLLHKELLRIKEAKKNKYSAYSRMKNVSIDYQIMEKAKNLYCVKGNFSWQDLGSWVNLGKLLSVSGGKKEKLKNISFGKTGLLDARDCIVYNSEKTTVGLVGVSDIIVVHTKNGTLVCAKSAAEKVKNLVTKLLKN